MLFLTLRMYFVFQGIVKDFPGLFHFVQQPENQENRKDVIAGKKINPREIRFIR